MDIKKDVPVVGEKYPVEVGESVINKQEASNLFFTLSYDFKPGSIYANQKGRIHVDHVDKRTDIFFQGENQGKRMYFSGPVAQSENYVVLVFDSESKSFKLQKVESSFVSVRKEEKSKRGFFTKNKFKTPSFTKVNEDKPDLDTLKAQRKPLIPNIKKRNSPMIVENKNIGTTKTRRGRPPKRLKTTSLISSASNKQIIQPVESLQSKQQQPKEVSSENQTLDSNNFKEYQNDVKKKKEEANEDDDLEESHFMIGVEDEDEDEEDKENHENISSSVNTQNNSIQSNTNNLHKDEQSSSVNIENAPMSMGGETFVAGEEVEGSEDDDSDDSSDSSDSSGSSDEDNDDDDDESDEEDDDDE